MQMELFSEAIVAAYYLRPVVNSLNKKWKNAGDFEMAWIIIHGLHYVCHFSGIQNLVSMYI